MHKGQNLECFACEPPYPPPIMQKGQFFYKTKLRIAKYDVNVGFKL